MGKYTLFFVILYMIKRKIIVYFAFANKSVHTFETQRMVIEKHLQSLNLEIKSEYKEVIPCKHDQLSIMPAIMKNPSFRKARNECIKTKTDYLAVCYENTEGKIDVLFFPNH